MTDATTIAKGLTEATYREALEFIADLPDPDEKAERGVTFYRVYAANLKLVAAKALGRQIVSQEALDWAEQWFNSPEGRAALSDHQRDGG